MSVKEEWLESRSQELQFQPWCTLCLCGEILRE
jgi:hypothetical protein